MKATAKLDNVSLSLVESATLLVKDGEEFVKKDTKEDVEDYLYFNPDLIVFAQFVMKPPKEVVKDETK